MLLVFSITVFISICSVHGKELYCPKNQFIHIVLCGESEDHEHSCSLIVDYCENKASCFLEFDDVPIDYNCYSDKYLVPMCLDAELQAKQLSLIYSKENNITCSCTIYPHQSNLHIYLKKLHFNNKNEIEDCEYADKKLIIYKHSIHGKKLALQRCSSVIVRKIQVFYNSDTTVDIEFYRQSELSLFIESKGVFNISCKSEKDIGFLTSEQTPPVTDMNVETKGREDRSPNVVESSKYYNLLTGLIIVCIVFFLILVVFLFYWKVTKYVQRMVRSSNVFEANPGTAHFLNYGYSHQNSVLTNDGTVENRQNFRTIDPVFTREVSTNYRTKSPYEKPIMSNDFNFRHSLPHIRGHSENNIPNLSNQGILKKPLDQVTNSTTEDKLLDNHRFDNGCNYEVPKDGFRYSSSEEEDASRKQARFDPAVEISFVRSSSVSYPSRPKMGLNGLGRFSTVGRKRGKNNFELVKLKKRVADIEFDISDVCDKVVENESYNNSIN